MSQHLPSRTTWKYKNDQEEYLDQDIRGNRGSDYSEQTRFEATNRKNADWPTPATLCRRRIEAPPVRLSPLGHARKSIWWMPWH
ncbi:hypothetical protein CLOSCI_02015 [[Clostridium] scindens ATCC 35704]|nr:hypothetical protein CLOSCI_02015 [[Clostridium] scindens ATCC 35704]